MAQVDFSEVTLTDKVDIEMKQSRGAKKLLNLLFYAPLTIRKLCLWHWRTIYVYIYTYCVNTPILIYNLAQKNQIKTIESKNISNKIRLVVSVTQSDSARAGRTLYCSDGNYVLSKIVGNESYIDYCMCIKYYRRILITIISNTIKLSSLLI